MANDPQKIYDTANGLDTPRPTGLMHVRVQGRSRDIALDLLGVSAASTDDAVRNSLAQFMEIAPELLRDTVIERHENGNMTVRPEAVFG